MQAVKKLFAPLDMTMGTPWKKILFFIVPMLIGNIFQQLYSTADAIIVGRYIGDGALAAVGNAMIMLFFILALFIGIASGAGIMVAQYFGAKRREELSYTIGNCLTMLTIAGVAFMILGPLATRPLLRLVNTPETILEWSAGYLDMMLWGILGLVYYNILTGILRGLGDSFSPLIYLIVANIVSIILSLLFVAVFEWGVAGTAIATVIAQFMSGIMCIRRLLQMRHIFDVGFKYLRPSKQYVMQMLRLGVPTGISQGVISLAMVMVQSLTNSFGDAFMTASTIVMRIDGFVMMPILSFGNAVMVFTGQNIGAGKLGRVRQGTRQGVWMAVGTSIGIVAIILLVGRQVAGFFTETQEVLDISLHMLRILTVGYIAMTLTQTLWGVIRGAGDTMTPMWLSLITVAVRVPAAYFLVFLTGSASAIFYSLLLTWIVGAVLAVVAYRNGKWRMMGIVKQDSINKKVQPT